ncbi:amidase [Halobacillus sp. A1]|uniref:amidase n=1 Tax=Halobacillus sp. A1 TaxID=2880262 RepID=UPI0020A697AD|nr:amidase [Halobacillus sp. A1]MCP3030966.1 amidase [Halobacillus sp. A1]
MIHDLNQLDGVAQLELLKKNQLKLSEVNEHYKEKLIKKNPDLQAVVHTMFDNFNGEWDESKGPYGGFPFLIKDLNAVKGEPLSLGSKIMEGFHAGADDEIVRRYKKAGLSIIGKTNTPEFGFTPATESEFLGFTKNPWNSNFSPGGSSGGAAAAVASGMIPFAHASDGGGSIRIPASCCGLFGLKPTRGRTPMSMRINSLAVHHAVTRSVRDSAALLDVLEGPQLGDSFSTPEKGAPFQRYTEEDPPPLKIAYMADFGSLMDIGPEVQRAIQSTAELCEELGHHVEIAYPDFDLHRFMNAYVTVWVVGGALAVKNAARLNNKEITSKNVERLLYTMIEKSERFTVFEYEEARQFLFDESIKVHQFFETYDVLLHPVNSKTPLPLGEYNGSKKHVDDILEVSSNYAHLTPVANVTGQPAMSVPLYWGENNLPIGSHFMGRFGEEALLFRLAGQLERARPWWGMYKQIDD